MIRILLILLAVASSTHGAVPSTAGTSFAFAFTRQGLGVTTGYLRVQISGHDSAASGTIDAPLASYNTTFTVQPGATTYVDLATYLRVSWGIESVGLYLTSSQPVSVYLFNSATLSTDATIVYPENQLGSEYIISSYTPYKSLFINQEVSSAFTVVPTVDATSIQLYKYNQTFSGWVLQNPYIANQRGNVVTVNSTSTDFTSYRIVSNAPVAVFSGLDCAVVPASASIRTTTMTAGCDTVVDQLIPISQWGSEYVAFADPAGVMKHRVRVTSDRDMNISLSSSATNVSVLAGSYYEFVITSAELITCTEPCQVTQFLHYGHSTVALNGDPYMVNLIPTSKHGRDFVFSIFDRGTTGLWSREYATIIAPTSQRTGLVLNGASVTGWTSIGSYSITAVRLSRSTATYSVTHIDSSVQFALYVSGQASFESYCYSVGSTFLTTSSTTATPTQVVALAGWAVGVLAVVSAGALASVGLAVFFWWKKRHRSKEVVDHDDRRIDEILTKRHLAMVANVRKRQYMDVAKRQRLKQPPKDAICDVDQLNEVMERPSHPIKPATPSKYAFDLDEDEMIRQVFAQTRATTPYRRDPELRDFVPEPPADILVINHPPPSRGRTPSRVGPTPSRAGRTPSRGGPPPSRAGRTPSRGGPPSSKAGRTSSRESPPPSTAGRTSTRESPPSSRGPPPSRSGTKEEKPPEKSPEKPLEKSPVKSPVKPRVKPPVKPPERPPVKAKYLEAAMRVGQNAKEAKNSISKSKKQNDNKKRGWQE